MPKRKHVLATMIFPWRPPFGPLQGHLQKGMILLTPFWITSSKGVRAILVPGRAEIWSFLKADKCPSNGPLRGNLQKGTILMTPLWGTSDRGGRAILAPGRAGRAKFKKGHKVCSFGVQDLSNEPLPIALPALPDEQARNLTIFIIW